MSKNMYLLISSFLSLIFFAIHNMKIILSIIVVINGEKSKSIDILLINTNIAVRIDKDFVKNFSCSFFKLSSWLEICHSSFGSYMPSN